MDQVHYYLDPQLGLGSEYKTTGKREVHKPGR